MSLLKFIVLRILRAKNSGLSNAYINNLTVYNYPTVAALLKARGYTLFPVQIKNTITVRIDW